MASLGSNPSNELCGRSLASKLSAQKADGLFLHPNNQQRVKEVHQSIWVPVNVQIAIVLFKRVLSSAISTHHDHNGPFETNPAPW